jgi:hypothetical protein
VLLRVNICGNATQQVTQSVASGYSAHMEHAVTHGRMGVTVALSAPWLGWACAR